MLIPKGRQCQAVLIKSVKKYEDVPLRMGTDCEDICVHMNAHQKASTTWETY